MGRSELSPAVIDDRELLSLCAGVSLQRGECTRIAWGSDGQGEICKEAVLDDLRVLAARTRRAGIRVDLIPDLLDRFLGTSAPRAPRREWFLARRELALVWEAALQTEPSALGLSLSHTKGAWLAAARGLDAEAAKSHTACIGVDIELADRIVSDRLLRRFAHDEDKCPGVPRIGIWAAKEALFKSDLGSGTRSLRDYTVTLELETDGLYKGQGTLTEGRIYAACLSGNGRYILAAAADTRPPTR